MSPIPDSVPHPKLAGTRGPSTCSVFGLGTTPCPAHSQYIEHSLKVHSFGTILAIIIPV